MAKTNWIPEGSHTITPHMAIRNANKAIEFYKKAFGAEEVMRMNRPDGKIMHAQLKIGDSLIMLGEEVPDKGSLSPETLKGTPVGLYLYVKDVDTAFKKALEAGAKSKMPVTDMFWGDRFGSLEDPFGHSWSLATHKEDVSIPEMKKRGQKFMEQYKGENP